MRTWIPILVLTMATVRSIAQPPGDAAVLLERRGTTNTHIILTTGPQGPINTLMNRFEFGYMGGFTLAPGHQGLIYYLAGMSPNLLQVDWLGAVQTLATLSGLGWVNALQTDASGDLLMLTSKRPSGLYRFSPGTRSVTTVASLSWLDPVAMEEELISGDMIVLDGAGRLVRVDRKGTVTSIGTLPLTSVYSTDQEMHSDFTDGSLLITHGEYFVRFDPRTRVVTTLMRAPPYSGFAGLDYDPFGRKFYRIDSWTNAFLLMRYDAPRNATSTVTVISRGTYGYDVVTLGSRMFAATSRPQRGQTYHLLLGVPGESGKGYVAAAALGTLRGIQTGDGRRIPLDPDPLFFSSLANPTVFENFQGVLDPTGRASLKVHLPSMPQLAGRRFFLAAVTYDTRGIRVISEPLGVTLE